MRNDFVATGFVRNETQDKLLLIYHKKLEKWLPPGGHLEENELPHEGAIREVLEETGIRAQVLDLSPDLVLPVEQERKVPAPAFILHERIPASRKDVEHMHVDFIYLMEAEESAVTIQEAEVSSAKWLSKAEILACDTFESVKQICQQILK